MVPSNEFIPLGLRSISFCELELHVIAESHRIKDKAVSPFESRIVWSRPFETSWQANQSLFCELNKNISARPIFGPTIWLSPSQRFADFE
jgi:hypothetical protein